MGVRLSSAPIRRVLHLNGYDAMGPERFHARFKREIGRFAGAWNVSVSVSDARIEPESASWRVTVSGEGWVSETEHVLIRWDDLIAAQRARPQHERLWQGFLAFWDVLIGGAAFGYLRHAWRYLLFFLYPYLVACLLMGGGFAIGWLAWGAGLPAVIAALLGAAAAYGLTLWPGERLHLNHLLDDWIVASKLVRAPDKVLSERLERAGALLEGEGERLVIGHSLGAVLAVELIERALAERARIGEVTLLTLGSSILKVALHREANWLRQALALLSSSQRVNWVEYQALVDPMNFYKTDPVAVLGLQGQGPVVRITRFSRLLKPDAYRRIKRNFFRLHCQFVSGNDLRAPFDYFMLACGPFRPLALARSADGAMSWLDTTGALADTARTHLTERSPQ